MQKKNTFKKAAPNHCGKLLVIYRFAALTPGFRIQMHAADWRGQGLKRTYLTHLHGCKKAPCLQDKKLNFMIFPKKVAYFTLFFTFSRKLPISHLESQCEIGDSLVWGNVNQTSDVVSK